jgi:LacI family transcriptional regulator
MSKSPQTNRDVGDPRGRTKRIGIDDTVTVRDVARAAGVSPMTVSNVINRRFRVSAMTRQRVEEAIRELNYRPHTSARGLRLSQCLSVGMLIIDESPTYLADPFITQVVAGLSNTLNQNGYVLALEGLRSGRIEHGQLTTSLRTDALCLLLSGSPETRRLIMDRLCALSQPLIIFQEHLRVAYKDCFVIRQDDRGGAALLITSLLAKGARRFLMLVPTLSWPAIEERIAGAKSALQQAQQQASLEVIHCGPAEFTHTQNALAAYLTRHDVPDAILAGNDQMGIAAVKLLKARGHAVPGDVRVTGFNAFDFWQYSDPILTSIRSQAYLMGTRGGEAAIARLKYGRFSDRQFVLSVELQPGESI